MRFLKKLAIFLFVLAIFSGCANAGDSKKVDKISEAEEKIVDKKDEEVKIVDSGYTVTDDNFLHFGFVVMNPSKDKAYELYKVMITAYDEKGDVLATTEQVMNKIQPGETQAFGSIMDCNGRRPAKVEFSSETGTQINPSADFIKSSDLSISGTNQRPDSLGGISFTGKVKNESNSDTDAVGITLILKKADKIVYGSTTYVDNLKSGEEKPFEINEYSLPEYDAYEITAHNWGF